MSGQRLGRFRIDRGIGSGDTGRVCAALLVEDAGPSSVDGVVAVASRGERT